jgi:hypothetical protein
MRKPSKEVLARFAEAETLAAQLLELKAEEDRLRELLEQIWRARTVAMGNLAVLADIAANTEIAEFELGEQNAH